MATAAELIRGSLRLIGMLAEGETPSNETYDDALNALNQLVESWSLDRINVFTMQNQNLTWPANYGTRTLGPTGQIVATRPTQIDHVYIVVDNISSPVVLMSTEQFDEIPDKTTTGTQFWAMVAGMYVPNIYLSVYPVPTTDIEMHVVSLLELTQPAALTTTLVLPPGYMRAFRHNLAVELAAEFGKQLDQSVVIGAQKSLAAVQRNNAPLDTLRMPAMLPGLRGAYSNIYEG